jgi:hypothetical protein
MKQQMVNAESAGLVLRSGLRVGVCAIEYLANGQISSASCEKERTAAPLGHRCKVGEDGESWSCKVDPSNYIYKTGMCGMNGMKHYLNRMEDPTIQLDQPLTDTSKCFT